jgi:hypothetical protein
MRCYQDTVGGNPHVAMTYALVWIISMRSAIARAAKILCKINEPTPSKHTVQY